MVEESLSAPALARNLLSKEVATFIRREIMSGRIRPGDRLIEATFAERLKTSKSPVREALRLLQAEGLVVISPHRGATVVQLDENHLWELDSLRALLEPFAAQQAAERIDPQGLSLLEELVTAMGDATDEVSLSTAHTKFHKTIILYSGHNRIIEIMNGLWSQMDLVLMLTHFGRIGREAVQRDHRMMLEGIRTKDPVKIKSLFEEHVYKTLPGLMDALREVCPSAQ